MNMNPTLEPLTYTVPLALAAHTKADQLRRRQTNASKAKQVYLNTLAVYAVQTYLQWRGIETDWEGSDSYHPIANTFMDVADLVIPTYGKLECRPVLSTADRVCIPEEVWSDRIGYVAVELQDSLREATVLGFFATATAKEMPIHQLRSLDEFIPYLSQFQPQPQPNHLTQWLSQLVTTGWETVESLLQVPESQLAYSFRRRTAGDIERGKLLKLEQAGESVILVVRLTATDESEIDISVEVYPVGTRSELPSNLQLIVLDATDTAVMQAAAGSSESLEFQFSGEPGERFSVKVALSNFSVTEMFVI